jgi:hypothetical protein
MAVNINVPSQVRTFANLAAFPASGAVKTIYIAEDTNKTYRWTGSVYVEISASGDLTGYVPYTGATGNVDLGTHTLSAKNIIVNHASGSGVAVSITKGGAGEALTITKTSGSGNAMSVTGGNVQFGTGLFWDGTNNRLGIGTSSPAQQLHVFTSVADTGMLLDSNTNPTFTIRRSGSDRLRLTATGSIGTINGVGNGLVFQRDGSEAMRIASPTSNVLINTTTDAGFRLDVNGTARVTNLNVNLSTGSIPFMGASGLVTQNNANLFWDNTNARLGIGTAIPLDTLHISTNANNIVRLSSNPTNANIISFRDIDGTSQGGFLSTGSTFSYGTYRSAQTTLNGGIGGVGLRTGNGANAHISFYSGNADGALSTERLRLVASTGNLLINTTTDAGFRLDVNGTARIDQTLRLNGTTSGTAIQFPGGRVDVDTNWIRIKSAGNVDMINIAQNFVGINATAATASAVLQADSTTRGFLPPRMTTTQRNAISSPAAGLIVYDTTLNLPHFFNGTIWVSL